MSEEYRKLEHFTIGDCLLESGEAGFYRVNATERYGIESSEYFVIEFIVDTKEQAFKIASALYGAEVDISYLNNSLYSVILDINKEEKNE